MPDFVGEPRSHGVGRTLSQRDDHVRALHGFGGVELVDERYMCGDSQPAGVLVDDFARALGGLH